MTADGSTRTLEATMGRIACALGFHRWRRHYENAATRNGIYYLCDRCRTERTLPRGEGLWGKYD